MPKLGDIVTINMCHLNGNEPTPAIVTKADADGSITCTVFPANGEAPATLYGVPARTTVDETYTSYGDPAPETTAAGDGTEAPTGSSIP